MRYVIFGGQLKATVVLIAVASILTGCPSSTSTGQQQAGPPSTAPGIQLDVKFTGGGQPEGPAPGNLIAAMKSPNKQGRWQPAIFLYSEQSATIEAKVGGQSQEVAVDFPEACCAITKTAGKGVTITAPVWTSDQKKNKRAYWFDLKVGGKVIDPVIIPR